MKLDIDSNTVEIILFYALAFTSIFGYFAYRLAYKVLNHVTHTREVDQYARHFGENKHLFTSFGSKFYSFAGKLVSNAYTMSMTKLGLSTFGEWSGNLLRQAERVYNTTQDRNMGQYIFDTVVTGVYDWFGPKASESEPEIQYACCPQGCMGPCECFVRERVGSCPYKPLTPDFDIDYFPRTPSSVIRRMPTFRPEGCIGATGQSFRSNTHTVCSPVESPCTPGRPSVSDIFAFHSRNSQQPSEQQPSEQQPKEKIFAQFTTMFTDIKTELGNDRTVNNFLDSFFAELKTLDIDWVNFCDKVATNQPNTAELMKFYSGMMTFSQKIDSDTQDRLREVLRNYAANSVSNHPFKRLCKMAYDWAESYTPFTMAEYLKLVLEWGSLYIDGPKPDIDSLVEIMRKTSPSLFEMFDSFIESFCDEQKRRKDGNVTTSKMFADFLTPTTVKVDNEGGINKMVSSIFGSSRLSELVEKAGTLEKILSPMPMPTTAPSTPSTPTPTTAPSTPTPTTTTAPSTPTYSPQTSRGPSPYDRRTARAPPTFDF